MALCTRFRFKKWFKVFRTIVNDKEVNCHDTLSRLKYRIGHQQTEEIMNIEQKDFEFMVDIMTRDLISLLMERQNMDMKAAFDMFYNSDTYASLNRPESGLYFQSPKYVYSILENEMKTGKMG